mgnify:CR=1 FL=1
MTDSFEQISAHNEELARDVVERASARGVTVSTAESLTAGMIASTIADIPGASAVLRGGAVTYCDEIKHRVLGVEQETLDRYDAVDINLYQANLYHTRMLIKEPQLQNYLFNTDIYELPPKTRLKIHSDLRREMIEIFSGKNIY